MVLSLAASAVALPSVAVAQDAMPAGPAGWHTERSDNRMTAVPPDLGADEIFVIGLEANLEPKGKALRDWFRQKVDASIGNLGRSVDDRDVVVARVGVEIATYGRRGTALDIGSAGRPSDTGFGLSVDAWSRSLPMGYAVRRTSTLRTSARCWPRRPSSATSAMNRKRSRSTSAS